MHNSIRISIVVCCHNSKTRLLQTLGALARQQDMPDDAWEVLVVDNASTDGTGDFAVDLWRGLGEPCRLRIVPETRLGLINARLAGVRAAAHEILSFVDDDNWVSPNWCSTICRLMSHHPDLGVIGSNNSAAFDAGQIVPAWFANLAHGYAVGRQGGQSGFIAGPMPRVFGAGLTIRTVAYRELLTLGFSPVLTGRSGARLAAGDDTELCYAVGLRGWKFWYEETLRLQHYMPPGRLTDEYALRLFNGLGYSAAFEGLYLRADGSLRKRLRELDSVRRIAAARGLLRHSARALLSAAGSDARRQELIEANFFRGLLTGLGERRRLRDSVKRQVATLTAAVRRRDMAAREELIANERV